MVIYIYEPLTLLEVLQGENKMQWEQAIQEEYQSFMNNHTWDLEKLPTRRKAMSCKWMFRIKCKGDGSVDCYKARLVARDFSQTYGVDFDETYALLVKFVLIRTLLAFAATLDLQIHHMDSLNVFLNKKTPRGSLHDTTRRI
jgi:hypothetical protein